MSERVTETCAITEQHWRLASGAAVAVAGRGDVEVDLREGEVRLASTVYNASALRMIWKSALATEIDHERHVGLRGETARMLFG